MKRVAIVIIAITICASVSADIFPSPTFDYMYAYKEDLCPPNEPMSCGLSDWELVPEGYLPADAMPDMTCPSRQIYRRFDLEAFCRRHNRCD